MYPAVSHRRQSRISPFKATMSSGTAVRGDKRRLGSAHLTILASVKGKGATPKDGSLLPLQADGMERREKEEQVLKREPGYRLRHFIGEMLQS